MACNSRCARARTTYHRSLGLSGSQLDSKFEGVIARLISVIYELVIKMLLRLHNSGGSLKESHIGKFRPKSAEVVGQRKRCRFQDFLELPAQPRGYIQVAKREALDDQNRKLMRGLLAKDG